MKIDTNVPPPRRLGARSKYPFNDMKVGDSVFISTAQANITSVRCSSYQVGLRRGFKFSVLKQDGGCRVWRVE